MGVDVVVCAHNEAERIAPVLEAIAASPALGKLIVVADACTDDTEAIASTFTSHVLPIAAKNKGTGMATGLAEVTTDLVAFMDADLRGLRSQTVTELLTVPPLDGQVVGLRDGYPHIFGIFPSLSGERRLPTAIARAADLAGSGWKAEMRINAEVAKAGLPWSHFVLNGVDNLSKFKAMENPGAWLWEQLQLFDATLQYLPELVAYATHPHGRMGSGSGSGSGT